MVNFRNSLQLKPDNPILKKQLRFDPEEEDA
jgi:hypothetical protein